ncbi:MAG: site-specific integrase [Bacteroidales bacterium]|nr:site-specific integrase [Bacteroidales bacterium]
MYTNNCLQRRNEMPAVKERKTHKRNQISVQGLIELRQTKIKNHTADVDLSLLKHLKNFYGKDIKVSDIDKNFCQLFVQYLVNEVRIKPNSAKTYLQKLHAILQEAVEMNFISHNPMPPINKLIPKISSKEKEYLTTNEILRLQKCECPHIVTKLAFLFSCYTGLRLSDIETLKWSDMQKQNNLYILIKTQVKTSTEVRVPLNKQAIKILKIVQDKKLSNDGNVFPMNSRTTIASDLRAWAKNAGIDKHITFHVSRISFVTLSIAAGINIYVVSKLCGHSNVKTTQIYARMIDRTYIDAVILFENFFEQKTINRNKQKKVALIL